MTYPNTDSEVIAFVSCVKKKRSSPALARDLYTSSLFVKARAYAERHADRWFILSAEYGLVHPDDQLSPYERTLNGAPISERREWAQRVHEQMRERGILKPGVSILWLAGANYQKDLSRLLNDFPQTDPLKGLRFGERLAWLTQ